MPGKIDGECQLCKFNKAIYRCPKCFVIYCSLPCFKTHKESCVDAATVVNEVIPPIQSKLELCTESTPIFVSEDDKEKDIIPVETLKQLGSSEHLKGLLENKHLRNMLHEVNTAKDQSKTLEKAMQIPIFTEFVDECLRVVEPEDE